MKALSTRKVLPFAPSPSILQQNPAASFAAAGKDTV